VYAKVDRTILIHEFVAMNILIGILTWDHIDWHTKRVLYEQLRWHFAEINTHPNTICFF